MSNSVTIRDCIGGRQVGQVLFMSLSSKIVDGLKSGRLKLAPSFMKYSDGRLELLEISIIPSEMSLSDSTKEQE